MLRFLPAPLRGVLAGLILLVNTLIFCWPLFIGALLKAALPFAGAQRSINYWVHACAQTWIAVNKGWMDLVQPIQWDVQGLESVDMHHSYLVTSNHQSWVDILILQYQLNRKAPFLKFFLKQELIWVPVIGLAWWALGFPFMKRYSKAYLAKHPEKKGADLATTRKTCAKFKNQPVGIFNFVEGTRFTEAKHGQQQSPFRYLLKPKAGGIAFVLDAMGEQLKSIVNVTIHYPGGRPGYWDLLCGNVREVVVVFEELSIPAEFLGRNYDQDAEYKLAFQSWINQLWEDKDRLLGELHREYPKS